MTTPRTPGEALGRAVAAASRGLVERETLVELVALCAVAGEHVLVLGPPGTAKSEAVRRIARALGGRYFEYLLGRFTEPAEIFGPVDLRLLREGVVETQTEGMLPEAELAFLDEVFLGSTAILNTLLGLLNERTFHRGHTHLSVPLRVCVGASNALPEEESLAAFADRFLVRMFVEPVAEPRLEELLEGGWALSQQVIEPIAQMQELDALAAAARAMDLGPVRPLLAQAIRRLRQAGIALSDRRAVKTQRLVAAAAVLAGRATATSADLWPIVFALPTKEAQRIGRDVLREVLESSENAALPSAALEASLGPIARARRLMCDGALVLEAADAGSAGWRLRVEGILRELDAGFATDALPADLAEFRQRVIAAIGSAAA